jgi:hypothetical protein
VLQVAVGPTPADAIRVNVVQRLLMAAGAAAMGDGLVERRKVFERRRFAFSGRVAQMLEQPAVRRLPCSFVCRLESLAEPLAYQRMGIERVGR